MATRWKLTLEYDGTPFVGWQRQENGLSVQQVLEEAIEKFSSERGETIVAGRTDAGVHALGQVAHFDTEKMRTAREVRDGLNFHLRPHPVVVVAAEAVESTFNARTSAVERRYLYRILNRKTPTALLKNKVWVLGYDLDVEAMHRAGQVLVGHHDFSTFRAAECQAKSPMRTLDSLTVSRVGEEIHIEARARSFLHHQIRNITGSLSLVGRGKWSVEDMRHALEAKNRCAGGPTAPPDGLYFMRVLYP